MFHKVIGILGQAGHGKDTCATILKEEFGFYRQALADELKKDIQIAFSNFSECTLLAQNSRSRAPWVRRLQQIYGTEWCRNRLGDDYWLLRWEKEAKRLFSEGEIGISIPDVRFPNELDFLKCRWQAYILYVDRPGYQEAGVDPNHESEVYVKSLRDVSDAVVVNDSDLIKLRSEVVAKVSNFCHSCRGVDANQFLL